MPTQEQISKIKKTFSNLYDLNVAGLEKDAEALSECIIAIGTDAKSQIIAGPLLENANLLPALEQEIDASTVSPDPRLSIRQIEVNIDEAVKYVQICQTIRERYADIGKARIDVRYKGEEFFRLDDVHEREIDSGLYRLPWQEATDEVEGVTAAIQHVGEQVSILEELLGHVDHGNPYASLLEEARINKNIDDNAQITRNTVKLAADESYRLALSTGEFRGNMELAAWSQTLAGAKATLSQLKSKLPQLLRKEIYLKKDELFKMQRREIARQIAWKQIEEHCQDYSEVNYDERLRQHKIIYAANIYPLIERALVVQEGIKKFYGITEEFGLLPSGEILDRISLWLVKVQDAISKWKRMQRLSVGQIVSDEIRIDPATGKFKVVIPVASEVFPHTRSLLRGVSLEFTGTRALPLTLTVTPPDNTMIEGQRPPLQIGRVCAVAPGVDLKPQHADILWNASPIGHWEISGVCPPGEDAPDKIIIYLWVVSS